jgi:hypothetical protein
VYVGFVLSIRCHEEDEKVKFDALF